MFHLEEIMRDSPRFSRWIWLGFFAAKAVQPQPSTPAHPPQPIYFHISHHQEAVGHPALGFPKYEKFKENLREELALLDRYGVVSDQAFSDFIVSVILYMRDSGRDPEAEDIFRWFNASHQNLGYHFHPSTWDILIRQYQVKDLDWEEAIAAYEKWEQAYYDWSTCTEMPSGDPYDFCGTLDTTRLGGVELMLQYFNKPVVNECLTLLHPAAGQVLRKKIGWNVPVIGQAGNAHSYYSTENSRYMWMSDWMFSTEPGIYVYKLMGNYFTQNRSEAWIERLLPVDQLKQALVNLPRDIPHYFAIHNTEYEAGHDPLQDHLEYLTKEFIPANPGSRFISTADIPNLILPNPRQFTMEDLQEGCLDVLYQWHGRPPACIRYGSNYMSLASLFKALQAALQAYLDQPSGLRVWLAQVEVADFILPPLGREWALPNDVRLGNGFPTASMIAAVQNLAKIDAIPYVVSIPLLGESGADTFKANAAEFLYAMASLFLQLRKGDELGNIYILPSYIIPISNLPQESAEGYRQNAKTHMDWIGELQLWTLEPVRLKGNDIANVNGREGFMPAQHKLCQNYPNPFNETTAIQFNLTATGRTRIQIYDMLGRAIRTLVDASCQAGWHTVIWDGCDDSGIPVCSDLYFYRLITDRYTYIRKASVIR